MSGEQVRAALAELRVTQAELAHEWGVTARQVYRWRESGCRRQIAVHFDAALRLKRLGLPWRKGEIAIALVAGGNIVQLTDEQAVARHARRMQAEAAAPMITTALPDGDHT